MVGCIDWLGDSFIAELLVHGKPSEVSATALDALLAVEWKPWRSKNGRPARLARVVTLGGLAARNADSTRWYGLLHRLVRPPLSVYAFILAPLLPLFRSGRPAPLMRILQSRYLRDAPLWERTLEARLQLHRLALVCN